MMKVLFVCLGNICRSPAAEAVMSRMVKDQHLEDKIFCDSSGTSALHAGSAADPRTRKAASQRGYDVTSISRKFIAEDFDKFDYILAMDENNYKDILKFPEAVKDKVHRFVDFCRKHSLKGVPDPYLGNQQGFDFVMDILEDGCANLLKEVTGSMG